MSEGAREQGYAGKKLPADQYVRDTRADQSAEVLNTNYDGKVGRWPEIAQAIQTERDDAAPPSNQPNVNQ